MSNFEFLKKEWPELYKSAKKAEDAVNPDPRTACFYARRTLELGVKWAFKYDKSLKLPYQENLSSLIHEPTFKVLAGDAVFSKARVINTLGNRAVHSPTSIPFDEGLVAVKELFHYYCWFAHTYSREKSPETGIKFDPQKIPQTISIPKQTIDQLQKLQSNLSEKDEKLAEVLADKDSLDEELKKLRAEVAKAKKDSERQTDAHDYSEAETRDYFIDLLLKEAGWLLNQEKDREFEVTGMPNQAETGYVDYVLWGDDGKPLGLVEAKSTKHNPRVGQQQAKIYADCLEQMFGQRPIIFYSNGYDHWIWDEHNYPPRVVQGFYKKNELELLIQRRNSKKELNPSEINHAIVGRHYQTRAITRITESFENDHQRKALLVMATGAGKTRTVIALCDLLIRCNWVKRVLFLADRVALVNQAVRAFRTHLPESSPVNLVTEKNTNGRVFVSTYPSIMGLINETKEGRRIFGVGHFDIVIIDEAHRSVFQRYRAIFEYFDSLLVGLTATPKDEVDRNTYGLFDLENGVPTDAYSLEEAVKDKYLVPPEPISVPLKFQREGIKYVELSEEEKEEWDELDWDEEGNIPDRVVSDAVNKWLFNIDTVDKVLEHLMTRGQKVAGGDRLGKTIIFAKNQDHANFISERFDINYPHYKGDFARVITHEIKYAQSLIDSFSIKDNSPHIAISVDMLDTGIDVPEVVNLVFFKIVRSKTKFWQMIGRGTRLCENLFGLNEHKEFFYIFDYCQNLEYFSQDPGNSEGSVTDSLSKRLFNTRLELIGVLDEKKEEKSYFEEEDLGAKENDEPCSQAAVRKNTAMLLFREVASMNIDNFIVRPKRKIVQKYTNQKEWENLTIENRQKLSQEVAGLPSGLEPEDEEAKRFDMIMLNLQLAVIRNEDFFEKLVKRVKIISALLEEKSSIPMVKKQIELIQDLQTEGWWEDVTIPMLERVRVRLRSLVKFIDKHPRHPLYTNFEDDMGDETEIELPNFITAKEFENFKKKTREFLRTNLQNVTINKLRMNKPLTELDLQELERILLEGVGNSEMIEQVKSHEHGLGIFVRSLVGLDREASKQAFAVFLHNKNFTANQIEFINMIIDHLTEKGIIEPGILYQSPFTDVSPRGPEDMFSKDNVTQIFEIINDVRKTAIAA